MSLSKGATETEREEREEKEMKYSTEALQKIMGTMKGMIRQYKGKSFEDLKLHISKGNSKIGRTHNFSTAPGITCPNCSKCIHYCYDIKACWQYENVRIARAENTAMMAMDRERTFDQIADYIAHRKLHKYFRWHVSGEIQDTDYFDHMVKIAKQFPEWVFWTYTKNYYAVNEWIRTHGNTKDAIPENLSVMFSVWNGMPCPNPYGLPTFTCIMEGMTPDPKEWRCPGNCEICLKAKRGCPYGESSNVDEH